MHGPTEADREAALALRVELADMTGFWHRTDDESPLCQALAAHRAAAEQRLLEKLAPYLRAIPDMPAVPIASGPVAVGETGRRQCEAAPRNLRHRPAA